MPCRLQSKEGPRGTLLRSLSNFGNSTCLTTSPCTTPEEINNDCSAYLISEWEDDKQRDRIIKRVYPRIFEDQLADWWTVEKDWPQKRDLKTFMLWFDLRFHSIVEDLVDDVLVVD
jgi:hypothetical protein